jgi:hypothetical protein
MNGRTPLDDDDLNNIQIKMNDHYDNKYLSEQQPSTFNNP